MTPAALALLFVAAVGHATWNFYAKSARNDLAFNVSYLLVSLAAYAPLVVVVCIIARPEIGLSTVLFCTVSGMLHIAYYALLTRGYREGDLSVVYPLARGTGPVLAVAGAIVLFGERPSPLVIAGTAMVAAGILMMSWPRDVTAARGAGASVVFALATGACIAAYTLWDKQGVERVNPVVYMYGIEVARILLFAPFLLASASARAAVPATLREQRDAVLAVGLLSPGAYLLVLLALSAAPVSYVAPAREVSVLIGALLGWRLLREAEPVRRMAGATAIVVGIFGLAMG